MTIGVRRLDRRDARRQFPVGHGWPPPAPVPQATRASNAWVSGKALSQAGERQMPIRGARAGLASGSPRSRPATAPANSAQSATLRAMTPTVSRLSDITFMPNRLIMPKLGL